MKKIFLPIITFVALGWTCSCIELLEPPDAFDEADLVFSGKVIDVVADNSGYFFEVTFEVIESWKGPTSSYTVIFTETESSMCGYNFQDGYNYLVYAYLNSNQNFTNNCTRTNLLANSIEDLEFLNQQTGCNDEFINIDGYCFFKGDIEVLQEMIDNSINSSWHDSNQCNEYDIYCGSPNPYMDQNGYVAIDGQWNLSLSSTDNGVVEPLELGYQIWENGRLKSLMCGAYIYCGLSGEIPESISNLTEIEVLRLEVNYFYGIVPDSICELSSLNYSDYLTFDLSHNYLCPPYPICIENSATQYMQTESCSSIGDLNGDSAINVVDVIILVNHILDPVIEAPYFYDVNDDGDINVLDVVELVEAILNI